MQCDSISKYGDEKRCQVLTLNVLIRFLAFDDFLRMLAFSCLDLIPRL